MSKNRGALRKPDLRNVRGVINSEVLITDLRFFFHVGSCVGETGTSPLQPSLPKIPLELNCDRVLDIHVGDVCTMQKLQCAEQLLLDLCPRHSLRRARAQLDNMDCTSARLNSIDTHAHFVRRAATTCRLLLQSRSLAGTCTQFRRSFAELTASLLL